jgi:hypothetical protein
MSFHNAHMVVHPFVGYGQHVSTAPPFPGPPPPVGMLPHVSGTTVANLHIKAKIATSVLGMGGFPLVARGTDAGFVVPHNSIPPGNGFLAIIIGLGSSKIMFGSSTVKIAVGGAGEDCGACIPPMVPFSLNLGCNEPISLPTDAVVAPNTVEVMMTFGDIIGGILDMALDIAISWIASKVGGAFNNWVQGLGARFLAGGSQAWSQVYWRELAEGMDDVGARILADAARREFVQESVEALSQSTVGKAAVDIVNETITKPLLLDPWTKPASEQPGTEAREAADGPAQPGNPPIHDTNDLNESSGVQTDDSIWP